MPQYPRLSRAFGKGAEMSYRESREKVKGKIKRLKRIGITILVFVLIAGLIFSWFYPPWVWKYYVRMPDISKRGRGELRLHFLDVGQGDCTILEFPDGKTMLIDGGDGTEAHTSAILRYVNALGIARLDFVLLTHPDSDHCGGLSRILKTKKIGLVYRPDIGDFTLNGEYAEFYAALKEEEISSEFSRRYLQIVSDSADYPYSLTFLSPYRSGTKGSPYDEINAGATSDELINDSSAVVWLDYFGTSALLCGDATTNVEEILMRDDGVDVFADYRVALRSTEILKVGHHGSRYSTSEKFVEYLGVRDAVISCGRNNVYGHPSESVCDVLAASGAEISRTDQHGNVMITVSVGGEYRVDKQYTEQ